MMKTNASLGPPQGWLCGRCGASVAPTECVCPNCITPRSVTATEADVRRFEMSGDTSQTVVTEGPHE